MNSMEKLQRTSHLMRIMVFVVLISTVSIATYGFLTHGQWWVSFGDEDFNQLWQQHTDAKVWLWAVASPLLAALLIGFYFLQRLLFELSHGHFYTKTSMRCLKWLAWISFIHVLYGMILTPIASFLVAPEQNIEINIRPLTLIILLCLPVLVHLFSAASELDKENKAII